MRQPGGPSRPRTAPSTRWAGRLCTFLLGLTGVAACSGVIAPSQSELDLQVPLRIGFDSVADAMQPSCGTLDCHGQAERNLRLFGGRGLRLADVGNSADGITTPAEYDADYWGVVALEPEIMATVVAEGGLAPERLILIRKGRGTTRHKGGTLMQPGDSLDDCLVAWLRGTLLTERCRKASKRSADSPL